MADGLAASQPEPELPRSDAASAAEPPAGTVWWPAWWAYTRLVLPAGGLALGGPEWYRVGRFLGPNISAHYRRYPVAWTVGAWEKAGLTDVGTRVMSLGGGLVMWGTRGSQ